MTIRRITISIPEAVARKIKRAAGRAPVSSWLTALVEEHLDDRALDRAWAEFCRDVKPTRPDSKRADALFSRLTKRRRKAA
jgi:hypothetical protein